MRKAKQKLKPNTVLREYWDNNERFADFLNMANMRKVLNRLAIRSIYADTQQHWGWSWKFLVRKIKNTYTMVCQCG